MSIHKFKFNFQLMLREIESRGVRIRCLGNTDIVEASLGNHVEYLVDYISRLTPGVYLPILDDKFYAKEFVRDKGFSVIPGEVFGPSQIREAVQYAGQLGYPVVLKPTNAGHGDLAFVNLKDEASFISAFTEFSKYTNLRNMLVEKYCLGDDYRFLVVADKDIAVVKRTLPIVIGDGVSSIRSLVDKENYRRMNPRNTCLCPIYIDDIEGTRALTEQGFTQDSVPEKDQIVVLRYHANVSWGAECENVLKIVHPSYLDLARGIHALLPGNQFTGIDLLVKDITRPVTKDSYSFCEFNSDPGFSLHHMPSKGTPHMILRSIVDILFPETVNDG
jgi:D-alanine-D-alanine ligase-like ATP-grasp enzyme